VHAHAFIYSQVILCQVCKNDTIVDSILVHEALTLSDNITLKSLASQKITLYNKTLLFSAGSMSIKNSVTWYQILQDKCSLAQ